MCGETALWLYYYSHTNMKHVTPVVACVRVILVCVYVCVCVCVCVYRWKVWGQYLFLKELILLFSNDALNWSLKTITLLQKWYFK